jgi:quercetin dioxygenase-like cupin family protein
MKKVFPLLLIMVMVQTTVSVWAEPQDVKVTAVMKSSTTINGQKIEYPKTDKAEMASILVEIQPGKENGRHMHPVPTYVQFLREQ